MLAKFKDIFFKLNNSKFSILTKFFFVSSGYKLINKETIKKERLTENPWGKKASKRQAKIWRRLVLNNTRRQDLIALNQALLSTNKTTGLLCEVGCGSAYLLDFINLNESRNFQYFGVDLSLEVLKISNHRGVLTQSRSFELPFKRNTFDILLDGATLIHILDWEKSIKEYARVTKKILILHSLTISPINENIYLRKYAYGQPVSEIIFSKSLLLNTCRDNGLVLKHIFEGDSYTAGNIATKNVFSQTWLLEKSYE